MESKWVPQAVPKAGANEKGKTWLAGLSLVAVSGGDLETLGMQRKALKIL